LASWFPPEASTDMHSLLRRLRSRRPIHAYSISQGMLLCALAVTGCSRGSRESSPSNSDVANAASRRANGSDSVASLAVVVVRPGLDAAESFTTFLEPLVDAPVVARHGGIVRSVAVREGQRVGRGAVLARLDDEDQRLELERAEAMAAQARAEHERASKAITNNLISQHDLEVAVARDRAAQAVAAQARLDCERCTIRAPIAGVVRLIRTQPNEMVQENQELFRVTETNHLKASLYLPPSLSRRLSVGDRVSAYAASDPAVGAPGRVRLVNPVADPVTGLFHVEIDFSGISGIAPGTEVRIGFAPEIAGAAASHPLGGAVLPRGAYLERVGNSLWVYRLEGGHVHRTSVELGQSGSDGFTVMTGLRPGDLVMAAGQLPPQDGAPATERAADVR
jgi:membrane fusion protein (multidrug efflux system)